MSKEPSAASQMSEQQIEETTASPVPGAGDDAAPESIGKIREILFGSQVRDYDRRLAGLEDRLLKELAAMQEETRRRFDAFEAYVKNEVDALTNRLSVAQQQREEMNDDWTRRLGETGRSLEKGISRLDDNSAQAHRDLRQQILEQSKSLSEEIRQKYTELAGALAREAQGLRSEKTDRSALASFFTEIASRLEKEPN